MSYNLHAFFKALPFKKNTMTHTGISFTPRCLANLAWTAVSKARYEKWQDGLNEAFRWFLGDWTFQLLFPLEGTAEMSHWQSDRPSPGGTHQKKRSVHLTQPYILHLLRFQRMKVNSCRIKMLLEIVADLIWLHFRILQGVTAFQFKELRN